MLCLLNLVEIFLHLTQSSNRSKSVVSLNNKSLWTSVYLRTYQYSISIFKKLLPNEYLEVTDLSSHSSGALDPKQKCTEPSGCPGGGAFCLPAAGTYVWLGLQTHHPSTCRASWHTSRVCLYIFSFSYSYCWKWSLP